MSKRKTSKISTLGSQITSVISVALVLFIGGILASLGIAAGRITNTILGDISLIVKLDMLATPQNVSEIGAYLNGASFARKVVYTSADDVLAQEMEYNADVLDLLGDNPYTAEYEVKLEPSYVHPDSISDISNRLMLIGGVDEVVSPVEMVKAVTSAARKITIVLASVAIVLLIISIVLIFNAVSIGVYGRRFIIRTMQLVGATSGFIRRPFVRAGFWSGVIAAILASLLLIATQIYISRLDIELYLNLPWSMLGAVCVGMLIGGIAICTLASLCATNRYLGASDDLLYS